MKASEEDLAFAHPHKPHTLRHSPSQMATSPLNHRDQRKRRNANAVSLQHGTANDVRIGPTRIHAEPLLSGMSPSVIMIVTDQVRAVIGISTQDIVLTRIGIGIAIAIGVTVTAMMVD
jgi:hypothetical protein